MVGRGKEVVGVIMVVRVTVQVLGRRRSGGQGRREISLFEP